MDLLDSDTLYLSSLAADGPAGSARQPSLAGYRLASRNPLTSTNPTGGANEDDNNTFKYSTNFTSSKYSDERSLYASSAAYAPSSLLASAKLGPPTSTGQANSSSSHANYTSSSSFGQHTQPTSTSAPATSALDNLLSYSLRTDYRDLLASSSGPATSGAEAAPSATTTSAAPTKTTNLASYLQDTSPLFTSGEDRHLATSQLANRTSSAAPKAGAGSSFVMPSNASTYSSLGHRDLAARLAGEPAQHQSILQRLFDDMRQIEDTVDSIEIPARGRCKVFMAKFGYDPFKQSPNDNPDAELAFNAGDYIMVFEDIDEDGYFIGELMDGRRGYVPSNWLDRLTGEDLFEFQANTLYKQAGTKGGPAALFGAADDELDSNSYPPEFYDAILSDTVNHSNFQHLLAPEDYHRMNDYVDLDDVDEVDDECLSDYERAEAEQMRRQVPPPQRLVLERQLNKCILVAWLHPQTAKGTIVSYQVYVDGVLKSTVPSGDRTKALLEGVDSSIPHRISVRAIDLHGRHSNDAGCTIVIGQRVPFAPSCVKASHITSDSALISWLPCNSNFHHVVAVNSVEVQTVRPGVYKHLINGLSANTLYRVWVRAKPGKIFPVDEKNPKKLESLTTYVDFKTMPKSLPDPPVNVQVEAGPQRRTLLVTWLPLTLNDFGSSNGCAVTGYAVFAGHKKLADIDSPTGDHALLDVSDLESLHKKSVTVRTKSGENLSQDSMPCQIPDEYLKSASSGASYHPAQQQQPHHRQHHHAPSHHQPHPAGRLSDSNLATGSSHSPRNFRGRGPNLHEANQHSVGGHTRSLAGARYVGGLGQRGRQMTRSLQNLESDSESRRSSIPAIEITRETSASDMINQTESYSEEEFESSMRFRGGVQRGKSASAAGRPGAARYRARQSHSMDGSSNFGPAGANQHHLQRAPFAQGQGRARHAIPTDVRYFVALFDYDPTTMSPNPNAAADELAFKEGSIIKVFGGLGEDGFYKGELDNQVGFVPSNVIKEITDFNQLTGMPSGQQQNLALARQMTPANAATNQHLAQLQQAQVPHQQQQMLDNQQQLAQASQQQQQQQAQAGGGVKRMLALYDYDPQENSPNADTESEIPFKGGDVIYVYGKMDADGFYMGEVERTKQRGLVPSNFLREDLGKMQQQPTFNQIQQQQRPAGAMTNQPFGGTLPVQQQPMDPGSGGPFGGLQPANQMQMQQLDGKQQMCPGVNLNVRGQLVDQQQQSMIQQQQVGANINRPTTLSLTGQQQQQQQPHHHPTNQMLLGPGAMTNQMQGLQQQQQQQQQLHNNSFGGPISNQQQANQFGANKVQPMVGMGQFGTSTSSQQQQPGGGVLSNLLSSGKQIIGAATTPRAPNQQPMMGGTNPMMNMVGVGQQQAQPQQQQLQMMNMPQANNSNFQSRANPMMSRPGASLNPAMSAFGLQQPDGLGSLQQSQAMMQLQQQPIGHNSMVGSQQQHQAGPQQGYAPQVGGLGRPGAIGGSGDEQGGNILNTVKNMFKL